LLANKLDRRQNEWLTTDNYYWLTEGHHQSVCLPRSIQHTRLKSGRTVG